MRLLPCRLVVPLFAVLCLVPPPAHAADARAILAQVRLATGGAAWSRIHALRIVARETTGPRTGRRDELEDVATGRYVTREAFPDANEAYGFDGVTVWAQARSGVAYPLGDDDARLGAANDAYRVARGWWFPERFPATIEDAGVKRDGATTYDTVQITPEGGRPFTLWIDRATHLIARDIERTAEHIAIARYSDYRPAGGVLIPYAIQRDDGVREMVDSVAVNPAFSESAFSLPPAPTAAIAARPVTMPFRLEHNEIIVPAFINGRGPFDCLFDSGGGLIVPPALVRRLGLADVGGSREYGGGEGSVASSRGALRSFAIGQATIGSAAFESFAVFSDAPERMIAGLEVLQRYVVRIDFDRMTMTLTPPRQFRAPRSGAVIPFHFQDNQPEILGSVDGIAARFAVDTGDNGSLLLLAPFARRYQLAERYHAHLPSSGMSITPTSGLWARAGVVVLNGADGREAVRVSRPVTDISRQHFGFDANRYVSANLGIGILKQFNLTFDYARHELIFERSHFYGRPDIFNRTGLRLGSGKTRGTVTAVYAGSPAARAGVHPGDRVLRINGIAERSITQNQWDAITREPVGTRLRLDIAGRGRRTLILADLL